MFNQIGFRDEKCTFQMSVDVNAFLFSGVGWLNEKSDEENCQSDGGTEDQCVEIFVENGFCCLQCSVMPQFVQQMEMMKPLNQIDQIIRWQKPDLERPTFFVRMSESIAPACSLCIDTSPYDFAHRVNPSARRYHQVNITIDICWERTNRFDERQTHADRSNRRRTIGKASQTISIVVQIDSFEEWILRLVRSRSHSDELIRRTEHPCMERYLCWSIERNRRSEVSLHQ